MFSANLLQRFIYYSLYENSGRRNRKTRYKHREGLVVAVIVLFFLISVIPSTGRLMFYDDTTPPVTTHSLDPPEPDGNNGWYVSDTNVTLNATDDMSGVKEIRYKIEDEGWNTISGDSGAFQVTEDGNDIIIQYYAIDNAGNEELITFFTIDMDQTKPIIDHDGVHLEAFKKCYFGDWYILFWTNATDATSGMDRVEMYINKGLHEINDSPDGILYEFVIMWSISLESVIFKWKHYDLAGWHEDDEINPYYIRDYSKSYFSEKQKTSQQQATPLKNMGMKWAENLFSFIKYRISIF